MPSRAAYSGALGEQAALTDAGLAGDEQQAPGAAVRTGHRPAHLGQLPFPPDQHRGAQLG
jgi:hypothetical protein